MEVSQDAALQMFRAYNTDFGYVTIRVTCNSPNNYVLFYVRSKFVLYTAVIVLLQTYLTSLHKIYLTKHSNTNFVNCVPPNEPIYSIRIWWQIGQGETFLQREVFSLISKGAIELRTSPNGK